MCALRKRVNTICCRKTNRTNPHSTEYSLSRRRKPARAVQRSRCRFNFCMRLFLRTGTKITCCVTVVNASTIGIEAVCFRHCKRRKVQTYQYVRPTFAVIPHVWYAAWQEGSDRNFSASNVTFLRILLCSDETGRKLLLNIAYCPGMRD